MPAKRMLLYPKDNWSCPECEWAGPVPSFMFNDRNKVEAILCPKCFYAPLTCYLPPDQRRIFLRLAEERAATADSHTHSPWNEETHW